MVFISNENACDWKKAHHTHKRTHASRSTSATIKWRNHQSFFKLGKITIIERNGINNGSALIRTYIRAVIIWSGKCSVRKVNHGILAFKSETGKKATTRSQCTKTNMMKKKAARLHIMLAPVCVQGSFGRIVQDVSIQLLFLFDFRLFAQVAVSQQVNSSHK